MIELDGTSIRLRRYRDTDAPYLFEEYFARKEASTFLTRGLHQNVEQTRATLARFGLWSADDASEFGWIIARRSDDQPVGVLFVFVQDRMAEIHYGVCIPAWRQGIATEAVRLASDWLVVAHAPLDGVCTVIDSDHVGSRRVLEKAGFSRSPELDRPLVIASFGPTPRKGLGYSRRIAR
jgi:ribosomal-protein-alanine N-acetyltransferase